MIGRYKVINDKYHRNNRIILAYIYQDYLLYAFHCSYFILIVTLEVRYHYYHYFIGEETEIQRSGVASTAQSQGARKGEGRI